MFAPLFGSKQEESTQDFAQTVMGIPDIPKIIFR